MDLDKKKKVPHFTMGHFRDFLNLIGVFLMLSVSFAHAKLLINGDKLQEYCS